MNRFCSGCLKQLPDVRHAEQPGGRLICFDLPLDLVKVIMLREKVAV